MLFFTFSFISGTVGFAGLAAVSSGIAQMLFFVFLILTGATFGSFLLAR
ncbi:MAG TPA: DUF1328 family protein [Geminicoccus sp.]|nr:DUF1328 family protein [Geminicoccus sp.]HEX2527891.1 DUF1328 family protein [Geminicoccus sp.]